MKPFLVLLLAGLFFVPQWASAAVYYVDATLGSNTNDGLATTTPWQTLSKVNATAFVAGDSILFKRGETFAGNLVVGQSGTSGNPITFGAYDAGDRPIINAAGNTHGIDIRTSKSYITLDNLHIRNATSNQILLLGPVSNVIINQCAVYGGATGGFTLQTGTFSGVIIRDSIATGYTGSGVRLQSATYTDIIIDGLTATSSAGTSGFAASSATTTNFLIANSVFSGHTSHGINVPTGTTTAFTLRNSTTTDNGGSGVQIGGGAKAGITIESLYSASNAVAGINFTLGSGSVFSNVSISSSTLSHNANRGLSLAAAASGIQVDRTTLNNVVASNNTSDGILFSGNATNVTATGITANNNSGSGIVFTVTAGAIMSGLSVGDATLSANGVNGLSFAGSGVGSDATATDIVAEGNLNDGYNIHGAWTNVIFDGVRALGNGVDGAGADGDGFSFHETSSGIIRNSIARDNKKSAVAHIGTASSTMYNNVFSHHTNGTLGLVSLLEGTTNTLYNNTIHSDAQTGIGVDISSTNPSSLYNNIISGFDQGVVKGSSGILSEDYNLAYGAGTANWSGLAPGQYSISGDPRFMGTDDEDFRLRGSSPAINAGTETRYATDIEGNAVYGAVRDMGAYEYQADPDAEETEESSDSSSRSGQTRRAPSPLADSVAEDGAVNSSQSELSALILSNRALFLSAKAQGIVLPAFVLQTLGLSSPASFFTRDLTLGSEGADVRALQTILISKGHIIPAGATGYFGEQTRAALARYQAANGIAPAAGYFGPLTRERLN